MTSDKWYKNLPPPRLPPSVERMSFYVTLPSNVRLKGRDDNNTNSNFVTKLSRPLGLRAAQWEVGLSEISYPKSWYNVRDCVFDCYVGWDHGHFRCVDGRYETMEDVASELNRVAEDNKLEHLLFFSYARRENRFRVRMRRTDHQKIVSIGFRTNLARVLGFEAPSGNKELPHDSPCCARDDEGEK